MKEDRMTLISVVKLFSKYFYYDVNSIIVLKDCYSKYLDGTFSFSLSACHGKMVVINSHYPTKRILIIGEDK
jgi:hypothetical protein